MSKNSNFDGWLWLIFGLLLIWAETRVTSSVIEEPYIGWNAMQYAWLIFAVVLVAISIYILIKN